MSVKPDMASFVKQLSEDDKRREELNDAYEDALLAHRIQGGFDITHPDVEKAKKALEQSTLTSDDMRIVIEKKQEKNLQGRQLNCRVFDDANSEEFKDYLNSLKNELPGARAQVVILDKQGAIAHWSTADILVGEKEISVLHFDSIARQDNIERIVNPVVDSKVNNSVTLNNVLKSSLGSEPGKPVKQVECYSPIKAAVQNDHESCATFALSTAITMSKLSNDNFEKLLDKSTLVQAKNAQAGNYSHIQVFSLPVTKMPADFLRNAQSGTLIGEHTKANEANQENSQLNKQKGSTTLKEYTQSRSYKPEGGREQNLGIKLKQAQYKQLVNNLRAVQKTDNNVSDSTETNTRSTKL